GRATMPRRGWGRSSETQLEERMYRMIDEVDPPRIVERARIAFESVGEAPEQRRRGRRLGARGRPPMLGHEVVRALSLAHVVTDRRSALDALAEDTGHEQREVADVLRHRHLVLGLEVRSIPGGAGFQQHLHDGFKAWDRGAPRVEVFGPREAV